MAAPPTVAAIIPIAELSQTLCVNDIYKRGLFTVDANLPRKIYCVRKNVENIYDLDPTEENLLNCAYLLYALCAPYNARAAIQLENSQGNGQTVVVNPGATYQWYSLVTTFGDESTDINGTPYFQRLVLVDAIQVNVMVINGQTKTLPPDFTFDTAAGEVAYTGNNFYTGDIIAMQFYRKIS